MFLETQTPGTTKADPFSLDTLIAWLERQPADREYCFVSTGNCLLAQYFKAHGFPHVSMGGTYMRAETGGNENRLTHPFIKTASGSPRTFSAALARARQFRSEL